MLANDCGQDRLLNDCCCCGCDFVFDFVFDMFVKFFRLVFFVAVIVKSNPGSFDDDESDIDFVRPLLAESSIGCRIRLRALINQLFTCNKVRFVSDAIVRFSSSVGYGC